MRFKDIFENKSTGTYIGINLSDSSIEKLNKWCTESLIPNCNKEFHVTFIYSKDDLPEDLEKPNYNLKINRNTYEYALFGDIENILVLKFKCDDLVDLWNKLRKKYNFQYDYPNYIPHITISYNVPKEFNIKKLELPNFPIELIGDYRETLF